MIDGSTAKVLADGILNLVNLYAIGCMQRLHEENEDVSANEWAEMLDEGIDEETSIGIEAILRTTEGDDMFIVPERRRKTVYNKVVGIAEDAHYQNAVHVSEELAGGRLADIADLGDEDIDRLDNNEVLEEASEKVKEILLEYSAYIDKLKEKEKRRG